MVYSPFLYLTLLLYTILFQSYTKPYLGGTGHPIRVISQDTGVLVTQLARPNVAEDRNAPGLWSNWVAAKKLELSQLEGI